MNKEEYLQELKELENEFEQKKTKLIVNCGLSQRKFNNGDIIRNHVYTIIVDMVKVYIDSERYPMPVYHGVSLTKSLVSKKNGERGAVYGNDGVELIKEYKNELQ